MARPLVLRLSQLIKEKQTLVIVIKGIHDLMFKVFFGAACREFLFIFSFPKTIRRYLVRQPSRFFLFQSEDELHQRKPWHQML